MSSTGVPAYLLPVLSPSWKGLPGQLSSFQTWAWCDVTAPGVHAQPHLPDTVPRDTTHLWGWTSGQQWCSLRVIAHDGAVVGALVSSAPRPGAQRVSLSRRKAELWSGEDERVSRAGRQWPALLTDPVHVLEVVSFEITSSNLTAFCMSFIECAPAGSGHA